MFREMYRFEFRDDIPVEEARATMQLALVAAESLLGETRVRLDALHHFDVEGRACVIDASTPVGADLNRLFTGFISREFGAKAFTVKRLAPNAAAAVASNLSKAI
jgi:hypothetical protein